MAETIFRLVLDFFITGLAVLFGAGCCVGLVLIGSLLVSLFSTIFGN